MLGFRVWDSENKEFCKNNYGSDWRQWCVRDDGRLCDRGDDFLEEYEEKRYIPMQSTGLFDIQGHTYWHPNFKQEKKRLSENEYQKLVHAQFVSSKKIIDKTGNTSITMLFMGLNPIFK